MIFNCFSVGQIFYFSPAAFWRGRGRGAKSGRKAKNNDQKNGWRRRAKRINAAFYEDIEVADVADDFLKDFKIRRYIPNDDVSERVWEFVDHEGYPNHIKLELLLRYVLPAQTSAGA